MRSSPTSLLDEAWAQVLERRLRDEILAANAGQCLRLSDVPRSLLESVAAALSQDGLATAEVYLVDRQAGPEPWRVGVHKVVERRNVGEAVILALFPPDLQLAAGDSVDVSTFRSIPVDGILPELERSLLARIPAEVSQLIPQLFEELKIQSPTRPMSRSERLRYLAAVAQQGGAPAAVGSALCELDLIPDFELFTSSEGLRRRLQRNLQAVARLTDMSATPIQRILSLPIEDSPFRQGLLGFFANRRPDQVRQWGAEVAGDSAYRDLALDRWPFREGGEPTGALQVLIHPVRLPRRPGSDDLVLVSSNPLPVQWQVSPRPLIDVPDLSSYRIEIVSSDGAVAWESPLLKATPTARRSRTLKDLGLDSGVYFCRVVALNEAGDPFKQELRDPEAGDQGKRTNESEDFLVITAEEEIDDVPTPLTNVSAQSFPHAELQARLTAIRQHKEPVVPRLQRASCNLPPESAAQRGIATLQFDLQRQYSVPLSQRLRRIEREAFADPDQGGHYSLTISGEPDRLDTLDIQLPEAMVQARSQLFKLAREQFSRIPTEDAEPYLGVTCLLDLLPLAETIEEYAMAYVDWCAAADTEASKLDVVLLKLSNEVICALLGPTHPIRLLWSLQKQELAHQMVKDVARSPQVPKELERTWLNDLAGNGLPQLLVLTPEEGFLDAGTLPGGWQAYLPPATRDSRNLLDRVREELGATSGYAGSVDISPSMLAEKLYAYLRQHAYSPALTLNVINPGDASLIVDALIELDHRLASDGTDIRYSVRLFAEKPEVENIGQAFVRLRDPGRQIPQAAERLVEPGQSYLFPKLSWSRARLRDFVENWEQFAGDVTLLLDAFPVSLRVGRTDTADRTSFVHGLLQEAPRRFVGRGQAFAWIRRPAPTSCPDLPAAPGRSGRIAMLLRSFGELQAQILAPGANTTGTTSTASLELDGKHQAILFAAHASSGWVLTIDPYLGLDYFDGARTSDRQGYLLDFTPEFVGSGGRQMLLSTKVGLEIIRLLQPLALQLGLDSDEVSAQLLIESLRSLSGRLALRLLSAPSQVQGALGMALARLFLEGYGLLENAIVIPLDAHPELQQAEEGVPRFRGDLLVVTANPGHRELECLIVETKCHSGVGLDAQLRARITEQLEGSERALRGAFSPTLHDPDRPDRSLQTWRLTTLLNFYLERAVRYGLISDTAAGALRPFFNDLDAGYSLSTREIGLVFRLEALGSVLYDENAEVPIWVVGGEAINRLVLDALARYKEGTLGRYQERPETAPDEPSPAPPPATMASDNTWDTVRDLFTGTTTQGPTAEARRTDAEGEAVDGVTREQPTSKSEVNGREQEESADHEAPEEKEPGPDFSVLLGDTHRTAQYGLVGEVAAEQWRRVALDLNGCNTISVFGVQGAGKSYTIGSVLEMALQPFDGINLLPKPLAGVVFHYHQTQDYPPEFVSMGLPNDDPEDLKRLAAFGAEAGAVEDLIILTTADTMAQREQQFPGIRIEPILFSSDELTVADWRFLMGATGNDALYLKQINEIMRKHRAGLTLETIRDELSFAHLTDSQRHLAEARLNFAERFIDDTRSLRSLMTPGRLLLVDLRDEFVEKDEALGLFVTMLNVLSSVGVLGEAFNKIIVFDEAHKYMTTGPLMNQVVEVIREMRHKGVNIIVASQDPINVPSSVVELASLVFLHRFNSPSWLKHVQKTHSALSDLTSAGLASLTPGEAYVWANKATDPAFTRRAVKVRLRPRATRHAGGTRTAV